MLYLFQVMTYTTAMLLIYFLFVRNRPVYQFSRYYLLMSAVLPFFFPLIKLPEAIQKHIEPIKFVHNFLPGTAINTTIQHIPVHNESHIPVYTLAWLIIATMILAWHLWSGYSLWLIVHSCEKINHDTYRLISSTGIGPGSFGKYIFFPSSEINVTILAHEKAHIAMHHTVDMIFMSILQAIAWPIMPLIWIKKEIRNIHEFQADAYVNADLADYTQLLLCSVFNTDKIPLLHAFHSYDLKRRLAMLGRKLLHK